METLKLDGNVAWAKMKEAFICGEQVGGKTIFDFRIGDRVRLQSNREAITLTVTPRYMDIARLHRSASI